MVVVDTPGHRYFLHAAMSSSPSSSAKSFQRASAPTPLSWRLWLAVSAGATLAGLGLSALGRLDRGGYSVALALAVLAFGNLWGYELRASLHHATSRVRRWRRPAPLGFLILFAAVGLGGAMHAPVNYDTLWYRLPRVLHWLAEGRWHWIDTQELRLNVISTGMEWLWAPLVAATKSDRLLFLPNWISFALLPGAVFSTFVRLGVSPRTAWWWMWLLPAGWIYAFQAGSAGNDAYSTVYALLMVNMALRSRAPGRESDWHWAMLAVALLTNAKQSNAPLGLLWLMAALPGWRIAVQRPWTTLGVAVCGALVSMIPTTALNLHHTGHWMGWSREQQIWVPFKPWVAVITNTVLISIHNLLPPIVPGTGAWNAWMAHLSDSATPLGQHLRGFEFFGHIPQAITEARAGLGPVLVLLAGWIAGARVFGKAKPSLRTQSIRQSTRWIRWSLWPVLVLFLSTMGCREPARYLATYYPFLLVFALGAAAPLGLLRSPAWRRAVTGTLAVSILLVLVSRQRPILTTPGVTGWLAEHAPFGRNLWAKIQRKQEDHLAEGNRLEPVLDAVRNERVIGFAAKSTGEVRLWEPMGTRRVVHVPPHVTADQIRSKGVRRVIVNDIAAVEEGDRDGMEWARKRGGIVVSAYPLSTTEAAARSARGETLDLEGLARGRAKPGETPPVDNLYVVDLTESAPAKSSVPRTRLEPPALRQ
jgi:hypothetical protein